ncbi:2-hydroxyacid dehydrogenase [Pedobacter gandavensis]|uniref:2-hydroxyacid dehydrogenase n=1 Tax=Pedobacter gandavensis TaxID=2679963 RepID=A0ABR6ESU2_9SPHI|nr:2-hydroxyacid dehydrogenase [Pedobacter gandavensis]MBB2148051.1 2-hydroxyacid dehydrogenase [Pedobacter gandavensis]
MKIAVFSTSQYDEDFLSQHNTGHQIVFFKASLSEESAVLAAGFDAVCIFVNDIMNKQVLDKLYQSGLKLVVLRCAGFNNVDVDYADQLKVPVLRVPAYSPEAVAEHAMALILTLNRKTHKAYNRVREGNFSLEKLMGINLNQRKVAVIGTGHIGQAFCRILKGFGCHIKAHDPFPSAEMRELGVEYGTLDATLQDVDIISLHCPLTVDTQYLINADRLQMIKPGTMLINTSRGGLVDTKAIISALKSGLIGSLGLDVYEQESGFFFHDFSELIIQDEQLSQLISFPNVLITGHQGFLTQEAMTEIAKVTFDNIDAFEAGSPLVNRVEIPH